MDVAVWSSVVSGFIGAIVGAALTGGIAWRIQYQQRLDAVAREIVIAAFARIDALQEGDPKAEAASSAGLFSAIQGFGLDARGHDFEIYQALLDARSELLGMHRGDEIAALNRLKKRIIEWRSHRISARILLRRLAELAGD